MSGLQFLSMLFSLGKSWFAWLRRRWGALEPTEKIQKRMKWKREFEAHSSAIKGSEFIIRHLRKTDSYPNTSEGEKGISPWFKVEYWGLYHRGIEVVIGVESVRRLGDEWVFCHYQDFGHINALVVGRIPFHVVTEVDWSGDEYYSIPHVYCEFPMKQHNQPYEEIVLSEHRSGDHQDYLVELDNYETTLSRSKRLGTRA